ncbi:MAG: ADP-ribosylation factor-like protein [Promethearchaeota archaeon]
MLADFLRLIKGFILFIGPSAAGKTSILRRLVTGNFEHQEPTLGFSEENIAKVRIIEIGGQASFRKHWEVALEQNPIHIFYVIDVTKNSDYDEYVEFIEQHQDTYPEIKEKIVLTANKMDLTNTSPTHLKDVNSLIKCSAKTGEGMLDILELIASHKNEAEAIKRRIEPVKEILLNDKNEEEERIESILKEFQNKF